MNHKQAPTAPGRSPRGPWAVSKTAQHKQLVGGLLGGPLDRPNYRPKMAVTTGGHLGGLFDRPLNRPKRAGAICSRAWLQLHAKINPYLNSIYINHNTCLMNDVLTIFKLPNIQIPQSNNPTQQLITIITTFLPNFSKSNPN